MGSLTDRYQLSETEIRQRLERPGDMAIESPYPPGFLAGKPRQAAVLVPLILNGKDWQILFIRRTSNDHDPHSGQVAFPGGASDPADHGPVDTALREASEEIGLNPEDVRILGQIHDFLTVTNYQVTPIVGVIPWPYHLRLANNEVSRVFTIPLEWLADPANREDQIRHLPAPFGPVSAIFYKPYDGEILWGATARFVTRLLELLG